MPSHDLEDLIMQGFSRTDAAFQKVEAELGVLYRQAYDDTVAEIAKLYARLGDKLDLPEARKYKRLEGLLKSIETEYKRITGQSVAIVGNSSAQAFQDAFYTYTWAMEQQGDLDVAKLMKSELSWGVIPTDAVIASVMSEASGLTYIKTFQKNMQGELWRIQSAITRGIANGTAFKKTAKELENLFNGGFSDAMRVVRTESGRNYTEGFLQAHDRAVEAGIKVKKRWVATLDGRTRHDHAVADGQYADENGNFHVGGAIGRGPGLLDSLAEDINCRCRAVDELEGFPPELRRYDGDIQPYQTFAQWAGPRGWNDKTGWPKLKK